jgi:hypothetical protein
VWVVGDVWKVGVVASWRRGVVASLPWGDGRMRGCVATWRGVAFLNPRLRNRNTLKNNTPIPTPRYHDHHVSRITYQLSNQSDAHASQRMI